MKLSKLELTYSTHGRSDDASIAKPLRILRQVFVLVPVETPSAGFREARDQGPPCSCL